MKNYKEAKQYRYKGYDYSQSGVYFVTICTWNKEMYFGDIVGTQNVGTQDFAFLRTGYRNKFGPQLKNLSSIIRGFKIGVTKYARSNNIDFAWQPRFHNRIIRNENELNHIRQYIRNNPARWESDRNEPENLYM